VELAEIAPGIDLERDILALMDFTPLMPAPPRPMDARIFALPPMGLRDDLVERPLERRFAYDPAENLFFLDFERLCVHSPEDIEAVRKAVEDFLAPIGGKVNAVVNYDGFSILPELEDAYADMVRGIVERRYLAVTRYTGNAFLRLKLGGAFARRRVEPRLHNSAAKARAGLGKPK
jgi:propionate CoA-transferase